MIIMTLKTADGLLTDVFETPIKKLLVDGRTTTKDWLEWALHSVEDEDMRLNMLKKAEQKGNAKRQTAHKATGTL